MLQKSTSSFLPSSSFFNESMLIYCYSQRQNTRRFLSCPLLGEGLLLCFLPTTFFPIGLKQLDPNAFKLLSRYESSGYDEASFRKVYHSSPMMYQQSQTQKSTAKITVQGDQQQQHTIESGPSFNESLERFRMATSSGNESDGGDFSPASKNSVFKQQRQAGAFSSAMTTSTSSSSVQRTAVTRSVEEQRTMITRNSQKSYHIE